MTGRRRSILALGLLSSCLIPAFSASGSETVTYAYDARGQLVQVGRSGSVNNGVNACYAYDKADNRANVNVTIASACAAPPAPSFSVSDVTVTEGTGSIVFTVTKAGSTSSSITVNYATANGTATAGADYTAKSGSLTFTPAQTSKTVSVSMTNDTAIESAETILLNLTSVSAGGLIADGQGAGTIQDNEGFAVGNTTAVEANQLSFTVTKTGSTSSSVTIAYGTANGTAAAGSDYLAKSGTLTFAAADTSKTVIVTGVSDTAIEPNETVFLNIYNASLGAIVDGQGIGTISDNDSPPSFSVGDVTATEGGQMTFTVTKSGLTSGSFSVNYATAGGTATSNSDFPAISGTMTFTAGQTSDTRTITATEDALVEGTEQFTFNLSGATGGATISDPVAVATITDNDTGGPVLTISDASTSEGGVLLFTVSKAGSGSASVSYATATGTAGSGDFQATSGTLNFTSGQTSQQISVQTNDNLNQENTETMTVNLSGAVGASIGDSVGVGTILDDDDLCMTCLQSEEPPGTE